MLIHEYYLEHLARERARQRDGEIEAVRRIRAETPAPRAHRRTRGLRRLLGDAFGSRMRRRRLG